MNKYFHHSLYNGCDLYLGNAFEVLSMLAEQGTKDNLILTAPPYGTTHSRKDSPINSPKTWQALRNVTIPGTAVLLFCQQPFTCVLETSSFKQLHNSWVWKKTQPTGFLNSKRISMKTHEDILAFYDKLPKYNSIKTICQRGYFCLKSAIIILFYFHVLDIVCW